MEQIRKPFQGVQNIIYFNWPFYVWAFGSFLFLIGVIRLAPESYQTYGYCTYLCIAFPFLFSLLASWYVYDLSDLYDLNWADSMSIHKGDHLINIHAGFDEFSFLLKTKFPDAQLDVFDFYDPLKHTEASIARARKTQQIFPDTTSINTIKMPVEKNTVDYVFLLLAAHEIRNAEERIYFFSEIEKALKASGEVVIIEHLRNTANFMAYNIGFFHFYSKRTWLKTFHKSGFKIKEEKRITPFLSMFTLGKNGTSL